ncbi:uncharacterized protein [Argopecten irradians]|uniref:uncharacterized protein n=1 Tax=Argopecten irradians TaxID=31199 RepID=UPI003722BD71
MRFACAVLASLACLSVVVKGDGYGGGSYYYQQPQQMYTGYGKVGACLLTIITDTADTGKVAVMRAIVDMEVIQRCYISYSIPRTKGCSAGSTRTRKRLRRRRIIWRFRRWIHLTPHYRSCIVTGAF